MQSLDRSPTPLQGKVMPTSNDIALANRLAEAAGAAIRPLFRGQWSEERKADRSYVTEADRAAEAAMRAIIEAERPADGTQGEEYGLRLPGFALAPGLGDRHRDRALQALALYGIERKPL